MKWNGGAIGLCVPPLERTRLGAPASIRAGHTARSTSVQLPAVPTAKS